MSAHPLVYCQFSPEHLRLSIPGTSHSYAVEPVVAINTTTNAIVEMGREAHARAGGTIVVRNAFRSERLVLDDFDLAEITFRYALERLYDRRKEGRLIPPLPYRPRMVMHPMRAQADRFSSFEAQGLIDLALRAGAMKAWVCIGPERTEQQLLRGSIFSERESAG